MSKRKSSEPNIDRDIETGEGMLEPSFGGKPVLCKCPHCGKEVTTQMKRKAGWMSRFGFVLSVLVGFGIFGCVLGAVVYNYLKNTLHKCPQCLNMIATVPAIELKGPSISDELWSFRSGAMAVIVTKKYVYIMFLTMLGLGSVWGISRRLQAEEQFYVDARRSTYSVTEYLADCGQAALEKNPLLCMTEFPNKYRNTRMWIEGKIESINEGFDVFFFKIENFLTVKINQGEDFLVFLHKDKLGDVAKLAPGDRVMLDVMLDSYGVVHSAYLREMRFQSSVAATAASTDRDTPTALSETNK